MESPTLALVVAPSDRKYTHTRARSFGLIAGIALSVVAESIGVHVLVQRLWVSALIVGLHVAVVWYLIRDYRAIGKKRSTITETEVQLEFGQRAHCRVPIASVVSVERASWREMERKGGGFLSVVPFGDPNVVLTVSRPVEVQLGFGRRKYATCLGLVFDDPDLFVSDLRSMITGPVVRASQPV